MKRLKGAMGGILAAGFIGFLTFGNTAFAGEVSRQQIIDALTAPPKISSFADRLRNTRSPTFDNRSEFSVASTQSLPAIDLEVYFDYNSAEITPRAEPQLRELGAPPSPIPSSRTPRSLSTATPTASAEMPSTRGCPSAAQGLSRSTS
jgi:hypothetical protein